MLFSRGFRLTYAFYCRFHWGFACAFFFTFHRGFWLWNTWFCGFYRCLRFWHALFGWFYRCLRFWHALFGWFSWCFFFSFYLKGVLNSECSKYQVPLVSCTGWLFGQAWFFGPIDFLDSFWSNFFEAKAWFFGRFYFLDRSGSNFQMRFCYLAEEVDVRCVSWKVFNLDTQILREKKISHRLILFIRWFFYSFFLRK